MRRHIRRHRSGDGAASVLLGRIGLLVVIKQSPKHADRLAQRNSALQSQLDDRRKPIAHQSSVDDQQLIVDQEQTERAAKKTDDPGEHRLAASVRGSHQAFADNRLIERFVGRTAPRRVHDSADLRGSPRSASARIDARWRPSVFVSIGRNEHRATHQHRLQ